MPPPPPPAPIPLSYSPMTHQSSSKNEPYGAVPYPAYSAATPTPRRRAAPSPYILSPLSPYGEPQPPSQTNAPGHKHHDYVYQHNTVTLLFLLVPLALLLWNHVSEAPLQALLCSILILYSMDLANLRDACIICLWLCFALVSGTNSWTLLMATEDHEAKGGPMLVVIFRIMVETMFFLCLVSTLHFAVYALLACLPYCNTFIIPRSLIPYRLPGSIFNSNGCIKIHLP
jgi:hypothetical protein